MDSRPSASHRADLIVEGGYTQSGIRQMFFGSVTTDILAQADLPVFMAH